MKIIPAIDIIDGKCVRLTRGDFDQKKVYGEDPIKMAQQFAEAGLTHLHVVDLDGARLKKVTNLEILQGICSQTTLKVDFGGGVQSDEDIERVWKAGAQQVTAGSIAVKRPELFKSWMLRYGAEKIILGADVIGERIAISGWQEQTEINLWSFLEEHLSMGVQYVICTDVDRDGLLQGPAIDLYQSIMTRFPQLKLIASGGVTSVEDLQQLQSINVYGAIIGKALYEAKITLEDLNKFIC